jgi:hypothetical protein
MRQIANFVMPRDNLDSGCAAEELMSLRDFLHTATAKYRLGLILKEINRLTAEHDRMVDELGENCEQEQISDLFNRVVNIQSKPINVRDLPDELSYEAIQSMLFMLTD